METAIDDGLIYKNVSRGIQLPKASRKEKRALTEEEKKALFKAKLTPKEKAFVYVLYYAGLRRGEALALTRTDINLKSGTIAVNKSLEFVGNSSSARSPKQVRQQGSTRDRTVRYCLKVLYAATKKSGSVSKRLWPVYVQYVIQKILESNLPENK